MKTAYCTFICLAALGFTPALAQELSPPPPAMPPRLNAPAPAPPPGGQFSERLQNIIQRAGTAAPSAEPSLTKFNLDFPGGTPQELVAAIEKAMGRQINVIVPDEYGSTKLPAFKMTNVTLPELFQAIGQVGGDSDRSATRAIQNTGSRPKGGLPTTRSGIFMPTKPLRRPKSAGFTHWRLTLTVA